MASDHVSSDPAPQCPTTALEQGSLSPGPQSQENVPQAAEIVTTLSEPNITFTSPWLVPSCFMIFDLEPLSLSFDFVFTSEIFKSLSFSLDRLCHLAILCLDQHAHTLHHLESLLTISLDNNCLDNLDILRKILNIKVLRKSLSLNLELS
ncbi:hypothetical protein Tco_1347434 [Tanacetum coccineum]